MKNSKVLGLIKGRHEMPVTEYIFDTVIVNVFDFAEMQSTLTNKLQGISKLEVYVTGLTVVTVELIKFCIKNRIELTLLHFNNATGEYVAQQVVHQHIDWDSQEIYMES